MGRTQIHYQNCRFLFDDQPSNTAIPQPTLLAALNNIRIQAVILPQYTFRPDRQTDRHTHTQTDRPATDTQPAAAGESVTHQPYVFYVRVNRVHYRLCNASAANGRFSLLLLSQSAFAM